MDELKKYYDWMQGEIKKLCDSHESDIMLIMNGDQPQDPGDWTEKELRNYNYFVDRATILSKAMQIVEEEQMADRMRQPGEYRG